MDSFFIIGNPRSGTTLFRLMLNAHPKISVAPESGFILWWWDKYKDWTAANISDATLNEFVADIQKSKKIETWNLDFGVYREFLSTKHPENYVELISTVHEYYALSRQKEAKLWGDKNNYYINELDKLINIFPKKKYIHIVRDGRDVACSYLELNSKKIDSIYAPKLGSDIEEIASEWQENVMRVMEQLGQNSCLYHVVKYEDLIVNTKDVLIGVSEFLGVEFSENMLTYYINEQDSNSASEPGDFHQWKEKIVRPPVGDSLMRYQRDLKVDQVDKFNTIACSALKMFGYPF